MEQPKFARHLPEGPLLDWVWENHVRNGRSAQNLKHGPGLATVKSLWSHITEDTAAHIARVSENAEVLQWIAATREKRANVRQALLGNPMLPIPAVLGMLGEREVTMAEAEALVQTRTPVELAQILLSGVELPVEPRQRAVWLGRGVAEQGGVTLSAAAALLEESYHTALLSEVLRQEPSTSVFPLDEVVTFVVDELEHVEENLGPQIWRMLGMHLAQRGTQKQVREVLARTRDPQLRSALLTARSATMQLVMQKLSPGEKVAVLELLPVERSIDVDDVAHLQFGGMPIRVVHDLHYTNEAASKLAAEAAAEVAGAVVWQVANDSTLIKELRNNDLSHRWCGLHMRRVNGVWGRLSNRVRSELVNELEADTLASLLPGPVREWIVSSGEAEVVSVLHLDRTELRTLLDRVERSGEAALAWVAAHKSERPRDRVRMAEIGLTGEHWQRETRKWLRAAGAGEIVKLWNVAPADRRGDLGRVLVSCIRGGDDSTWLEKLVGELAIPWQESGAAVQETAAAWLAANFDGTEDEWGIIWNLYGEWSGTLTDLLETAALL